jgi:hypothetical protein
MADVYGAMLDRQSGAIADQPAPAPQATDNVIPVISQDTQQRRLDVIDQPAPAPQQQQQVINGFNEEAFFSEKSGGKYKTWDEIQGAINKQPEIVKETSAPAFANDTSRQVYELLAAGKWKDVLPVLQQTAFADSVNSMSDDDIITAHIEAQYPSLKGPAAKRQFERIYGFNSNGMSDDDIQIEQNMIGDRKKIDAANARKYFAASVQELQFPALQQSTPEVQMSDAAKQIMQFGHDFAKPDNSVFPFEFAPEGSQLNVKGQIALNSEKITQLSEQIGDSPEAFIAGFIQKNWMKDGKFDKAALARDLAVLSDAPSMINSVAGKVVNQVLEQRIAIEKNIRDGNAPAGGTAADVGGGDQMAMWDKFFHIPSERKTA